MELAGNEEKSKRVEKTSIAAYRAAVGDWPFLLSEPKHRKWGKSLWNPEERVTPETAKCVIPYMRILVELCKNYLVLDRVRSVQWMRLEILREGLDDYDYMMMLENCIKEANPGQKSLVKKAEKVLGFGSEVFVNDAEYTKDPGILMKYRRQMGELLEQFYKNKNEFCRE